MTVLKKSYLYIDDCIDALVLGFSELSSGIEIFNVGSDDQVDTNTIARIILAELVFKLHNLDSVCTDNSYVCNISNLLIIIV